MPRDLWLVVLSFSAAALIIGTIRIAWQLRPRQVSSNLTTTDAKTATQLHEVIEHILRQLETPVALALVDLNVTLQEGTANLPVPAMFPDAFKNVLLRAVSRAAGGSVLVSAQKSGATLQVIVSDDGRPVSPDVMMAELRHNADAFALLGGAIQARNSGQSGNVLVLQIVITQTERSASQPTWVRSPPTRTSTTSDLNC